MISLASVQPTFSLVTVVSRRQPARQMKPTQVPNAAVTLAATRGWLQQCAQLVLNGLIWTGYVYKIWRPFFDTIFTEAIYIFRTYEADFGSVTSS